MSMIVVPPARRAMLEGMSDAQLACEIASITKGIAFHGPHAERSLRARLATDALRQSFSFAKQVQRERSR